MHTRIILAAVLALATIATPSAMAQNWTRQQVAPGWAPRSAAEIRW
jgi:hypothetical protein